MRSTRSYQREIKTLKEVIEGIQWVMPSYNGSPSCSGCGAQEHMGCADSCHVAKITGDHRRPEPIDRSQEKPEPTKS